VTLPTYEARTGGNPRLGRHIITQRHCGTCHTIPGIVGANGVFGPPLTDFARRSMIAGNFPNTPKNLASWIRDPEAMKPQTAMPSLGLSEQQARNVAAYLYTLR
jgi:cytochrome c1